MRRRVFIAGLGSVAAAWPRATSAQTRTAMPVIGYLHPGSVEQFRESFAAFHRGLAETGYVEGRNVAIEYQWAGDHSDRLPALAEELVRRRVKVIATPDSQAAALAAHAATRTIPIVFMVGADLEAGMTGKWLQLLAEIAPHVKRAAIMFNPDAGGLGPFYLPAFNAAARSLNVEPILAHSRQRIQVKKCGFAVRISGRICQKLLTGTSNNDDFVGLIAGASRR